MPPRLDQLELGVVPQEAGNRPFVFGRGKSTGGVGQQPTRSHHVRSVFEDACLADRAAFHQLRRPLLPCGFAPAEHAFAAARRVDQHPVEEAVETAGQAFRGLVGDRGIADAPAFQVLGQVPHTAAMDLIGHQQPLVLHQGRDVRGFAPGGARQVQDALSGLGIERCGDGHGRGVLEIIQPCRVIRVLAGLFIFASHEAGGRPRDRGETERRKRAEVFWETASGYWRAILGSGRAIAGQKSIVLIAEQALHPFEKGLGKRDPYLLSLPASKAHRTTIGAWVAASPEHTGFRLAQDDLPAAKQGTILPTG